MIDPLPLPIEPSSPRVKSSDDAVFNLADDLHCPRDARCIIRERLIRRRRESQREDGEECDRLVSH